MKIKCKICGKRKEGIFLRSYNLKICFSCFISFFEKRVQNTIEKFRMFKREEKILVAVSGGKDSLSLAMALHDLGYDITLFHINAGFEKNNISKIAQEKVENFAKKYNLPLKIVEVKKELGVSIYEASKFTGKEICGVCGLVRRYLMNREAMDFDCIVTGHTLNDEVSYLLKGLLFWQDELLARHFPVLKEKKSLKRKAKPLCLISEFETKKFCEIKGIDYQKETCPFRGGSYVFFKKLVQEIEKEMPSAILGFYKGFLKRKRKLFGKMEEKDLSPCQKCGSLTSVKICSFCRLKEKIEKNLMEKFKKSSIK